MDTVIALCSLLISLSGFGISLYLHLSRYKPPQIMDVRAWWLIYDHEPTVRLDFILSNPSELPYTLTSVSLRCFHSAGKCYPTHIWFLQCLQPISSSPIASHTSRSPSFPETVPEAPLPTVLPVVLPPHQSCKMSVLFPTSSSHELLDLVSQNPESLPLSLASRVSNSLAIFVDRMHPNTKFYDPSLGSPLPRDVTLRAVRKDISRKYPLLPYKLRLQSGHRVSSHRLGKTLLCGKQKNP